jgi:Calcineurin-like phosphoesterase/Ankyrin repeats (3 copies)/Ankyrin repeats (many copies)
MSTIQKYSFSGICYAIVFSLLVLPLWANHPLVTNPEDGSDLSIDGPHIFYYSNKAVVKSIRLHEGEFELVEAEYASREEVPALECVLDDKFAFQINLKDEITPMPEVVSQPSRVFAISDIEGNFHAFVTTLMGNGVVDKKLNWSYGDGHLVLLGDFFDRGLNVTACLWLIYQLENQAAESGGMVHFILGNHEEMNLSGDHRYVRSKYIQVAKKMNCDYADLYSPRTELGRWLRSKNIMVKIGETIFVHGGLSPQMAGTNISIEQINKICRAHIGKKADELQEKGGNISMVFAKTGPFWYRGFFNELSTDMVADILGQYDARQVVVGHTIIDDLSTLHDGMVYAIDVKHNEKIKNMQYNAMLIEDGTFYKVNCQGKKAVIEMARKSSDDGSAIICKAIEEHDIDMVQAFLKEGNKINAPYSDKQYHLLHYAIEHGDEAIVKFLLDRGADPNLFYDGRTALMQAIKYDNRAAVAVLLAIPVNVNQKNHRDQTALFYVAKYGTEEDAKLLLFSGAKIDLVDQAGLSPFQFAVKNKNVAVAKYLKSVEGKAKG